MKRTHALASSLAAVTLGLACPAWATDYYVSPKGNDSNDGRTPQTAWQTLAKLFETSWKTKTIKPGDSILLEAGQTFDGPLKIGGASGTETEPIRLGSFGGGKAKIINSKGAAIYLNSNHYLKFSNFEAVAPSGAGILLGSGTGCSNIDFDSVYVHDCGGDGVNSNNKEDAKISLSNSIIDNVDGCGVFFRGAQFSIIHNIIKNTGLNRAGTINYPLHGIYAKGPAPIITENIIATYQASAISFRCNSGLIASNQTDATIRGIRGISYFQETDKPGLTKIINNRIKGPSIEGIGINNGATSKDYSADPDMASTTESFVICENHITMKSEPKSRGEGIRLLKVVAADISGNIVDGTFNIAYSAYNPTSGKYSEFNNVWVTKEAAFKWNGSSPMTLTEFRTKSKQGKGDTTSHSARPGQQTLPTTTQTAPQLPQTTGQPGQARQPAQPFWARPPQLTNQPPSQIKR